LGKADDIRDFEIEGMSIGDSLLDYMSKGEIKKKMNAETSFWYKTNAYVSILIKSDNFKVYEEIGIVIEPTDNNFIMHSIEGTFNYNDNINECYKKQNIITSDLKDMFYDDAKFNTFTREYSADKSGKSTSKYNDFVFPDDSAIRVICYDMNKDFIDPNDQLYLAIVSKQFMKWLNNN
jgi:hypothetical protein